MDRRDFLGLALAAPLALEAAGGSARELSAGLLSIVFEPELGFVRFVRWGNTEILRGIYAAVRDEVWGTVAPKLSNLRFEESDGHFVIEFDVACVEKAIDFFWKGRVEGKADGTLRFEFHGEARSAFQRNRIGFCILHPMEVAGQPFAGEDPGGALVEGRFPVAISPHQPVKNLRAITHGMEGERFEVRMEGDVWEMEDHRNWTDGNFKTYCTPLERPWPVKVEKGTRIEQSVTLRRVNPDLARPAARVAGGATTVTCDLKGSGTRVPSIGLEWKRGAAPVWASHVRVEIRSDADWQRARALGVPLEAAVFGDPAEMKLTGVGKVARWIVYGDVAKARAVLEKLAPGAPVGGGTNEYFTELNRARPSAETIDFACYSINPQVHAFDELSLVENLAPQADTVWTAKQFLNGKPVVVTPVTLRPRFNPQSKDKTPTPPDPRQTSQFAAAWTVGSLKYLVEAGAQSVTYYETEGAGGIRDGARVYPLSYPLEDVAAFTGAECLVTTTSDRFRGVALYLKRGARQRIVLANLAPELTRLRMPSVDLGRQYTVRFLEEGAVREETRTPRRGGTGSLEVAMGAYGVATVDF